LRTPFGIARWNLDLLKKATSFEEEAPFKQDLGIGLEQLGNIIKDLITVSDLGFAYKNALRMPIDLVAIVGQLKAKWAQAIADKHIVWEDKVSGKISQVFGNSLYATAVMENLLDNALTYTKDKGHITVEWSADDKAVHFAVKDDGIGIPDKDKDLLFTQFFRATNAIDMKNVGTGLGLYICKTIVTGHGGSIRLESQIGKGTEVFVDWPINPE
jgi:signal transduction histidine kinase